MSGPRPAPVLWVLLHDLGRTGVPIALQRTLAWHRAAPTAEVHVIARHDGPLRDHLAPLVASLTTLGPATGRTPSGAVAAGLAEAGLAGAGRAVAHRAWRRRAAHLPRPDVVLVHGAGGAAPWTALAPRLAQPHRLAVHLHELEVGLDRSLPGDAAEALFGQADRILAVGPAVAAAAAARGADPARISVVPGSLSDDDVRAAHDPIARSLGPRGTRLVVGVGAPGWRKGSDRFVAVAHALAHRVPDAELRWVGGRPDADAPFAIEARLPTTWRPASADPWGELGRPAALLVPSREDPLPLVALEAGARGVPVVAARTGDLPDLLADGRGLVVDGHDLQGLADAVEATLLDPAAAAARAVALRAHVLAHHAPEAVGPRWAEAVFGTTPAGDGAAST